MPPCGCFHSPPAPLRLIVSSVVRLGLHLDAQLVLVGAPGDRPLQRGKGGHGDAKRHKFRGEKKHLLDSHPEQLVGRRWQIYLQMLETSGLGQI